MIEPWKLPAKQEGQPEWKRKTAV